MVDLLLSMLLLWGQARYDYYEASTTTRIQQVLVASELFQKQQEQSVRVPTPTVQKPLQEYGYAGGSFRVGVEKVQRSSEQCVVCARRLSSVNTIYGNANTWVSQAKQQGYQVGTMPQVGAVLYEAHFHPVGHVSVVTQMEHDGFWVSECNYVAGWQTRRKVYFSSRNIFIYPK